MQATPHLPPVAPNSNQGQPDAYEMLFNLFEKKELTNLVEAQDRQAQETRDDIDEALATDLDYYVHGYGIPGEVDRTPSEIKDIKVTPHASLVAE